MHRGSFSWFSFAKSDLSSLVLNLKFRFPFSSRFFLLKSFSQNLLSSPDLQCDSIVLQTVTMFLKLSYVHFNLDSKVSIYQCLPYFSNFLTFILTWTGRSAYTSTEVYLVLGSLVHSAVVSLIGYVSEMLRLKFVTRYVRRNQLNLQEGVSRVVLVQVHW